MPVTVPTLTDVVAEPSPMQPRSARVLRGVPEPRPRAAPRHSSPADVVIGALALGALALGALEIGRLAIGALRGRRTRQR